MTVAPLWRSKGTWAGTTWTKQGKCIFAGKLANLGEEGLKWGTLGRDCHNMERRGGTLVTEEAEGTSTTAKDFALHWWKLCAHLKWAVYKYSHHNDWSTPSSVLNGELAGSYGSEGITASHLMAVFCYPAISLWRDSGWCVLLWDRRSLKVTGLEGNFNHSDICWMGESSPAEVVMQQVHRKLVVCPCSKDKPYPRLH